MAKLSESLLRKIIKEELKKVVILEQWGTKAEPVPSFRMLRRVAPREMVEAAGKAQNLTDEEQKVAEEIRSLGARTESKYWFIFTDENPVELWSVGAPMETWPYILTPGGGANLVKDYDRKIIEKLGIPLDSAYKKVVAEINKASGR